MNFKSNVTLCYSNLTQTAYWFYINQLPTFYAKCFLLFTNIGILGSPTLTALHTCYMHYSGAHQKSRLKVKAIKLATEKL